MKPIDYLADRVRRLGDTLLTLRRRVREAVANELGRAVGEAVQDVLRTVVAGTAPTPAYAARTHDEYDDEPDWDDAPTRYPSDATKIANESVPPVEGRLPTAVVTGFAAARWAAERHLPNWASAGVGLFAMAIAWCGGPFVHALTTALAAAADLARCGSPASV